MQPLHPYVLITLAMKLEPLARKPDQVFDEQRSIGYRLEHSWGPVPCSSTGLLLYAPDH